MAQTIRPTVIQGQVVNNNQRKDTMSNIISLLGLLTNIAGTTISTVNQNKIRKADEIYRTIIKPSIDANAGDPVTAYKQNPALFDSWARLQGKTGEEMLAWLSTVGQKGGAKQTAAGIAAEAAAAVAADAVRYGDQQPPSISRNPYETQRSQQQLPKQFTPQQKKVVDSQLFSLASKIKDQKNLKYKTFSTEQQSQYKEAISKFPKWMQVYLEEEEEEEEGIPVEADGRTTQMQNYNNQTGDVHHPVMVGEKEFIMNKNAVAKYGPLLEKMNNETPNPDAHLAPDSVPVAACGKEMPVASIGGILSGIGAGLGILQTLFGGNEQQDQTQTGTTFGGNVIGKTEGGIKPIIQYNPYNLPVMDEGGSPQQYQYQQQPQLGGNFVNPQTGQPFVDPRTGGQSNVRNYEALPIDQLAIGISAGTIPMDALSTVKLQQVQMYLEQQAMQLQSQKNQAIGNTPVPEGTLFVSPSFYTAHQDKYEVVTEMLENPEAYNYSPSMNQIAVREKQQVEAPVDAVSSAAPNGTGVRPKTEEPVVSPPPVSSPIVTEAIAKTTDEPVTYTNKERGALVQAAPKAKRWLATNKEYFRTAQDVRQIEYFLNTFYPEGMDRLDLLTDVAQAESLHQGQKRLAQTDEELKIRVKTLEESIRQFDEEMNYKWTALSSNNDLQRWKTMMAENAQMFKETNDRAWEQAKIVDSHIWAEMNKIATRLKKDIHSPEVQEAFTEALQNNPALLDMVNVNLGVIGQMTQYPIIEQYLEVSKDPKSIIEDKYRGLTRLYVKFRYWLTNDPERILGAGYSVGETKQDVTTYERTSLLNPAYANQSIMTPQEQSIPSTTGPTAADIAADYDF